MEPNRSDKKPIKRSKYIAALSRDHHAGLLFCWKIKEGLKRGIDTMRIDRYAKYFWEEHLQFHFKEEEVLLFDKLDNDLTAIAKQEHTVLAEWFNRIIHNQLEHFRDYFFFTDLLTNHIRYEERVVFPFLEEHLQKDDLEAVGKTLEEEHAVAFDDTYSDEFWVKKV